MSESLDDDKKNLGRRKLIIGGTAAALAATAIAGGAKILSDQSERSVDKKEAEKAKHALDFYMAYNNGALQKNLDSFKAVEHAVKEEIEKGEKSKYKVRLGRIVPADEEKIKALYEPIVQEKNALLKDLDKALIPRLLVLYIKTLGIDADKSLVIEYRAARGDAEKVKRLGEAGIDDEVLASIESRMTYDFTFGESQGRQIGDVRANTLEFVRKSH
jgi:hypothetical protein